MMRLRVSFDSTFGLACPKVLVGVPSGVVSGSDLIEYLKESFGLPVKSLSQVSLSIDGFLVRPDQPVRDVLGKDDVIQVAMNPVIGHVVSCCPSGKSSLSVDFEATNYLVSDPASHQISSEEIVREIPLSMTSIEENLIKNVPADIRMVEAGVEEQTSTSSPMAQPSDGGEPQVLVSLVEEDNLQPTRKRNLSVDSDLPELSAGDELIPDYLVKAVCGAPITPMTVAPPDESVIDLSERCRPIAVGDKIRFVEDGLSEHTIGVVEGIDTALWGEKDPVIIFKDHNESWDTLRLCKMNELEVIEKFRGDVVVDLVPESSKEPAIDLLSGQPAVGSEKKSEKKSSRERQRDKSIAAMRRQIEWYVRDEGPLGIEDIANRTRIRDMSEEIEDVVEAIARSSKIRLGQNQVIVLA